MTDRVKAYLDRKGLTAKEVIQAVAALGLITGVTLVMLYGVIAALLG
jgi:hypothetical protein